MRDLGLRGLVALVVLVAACASAPHPRAQAGSGGSAAVPGQDPIEDAHALWLRIRVNAEKACAAGAADPNRGWLDRTLDSDGRDLFTLLSKPEFDPYAAIRDVVRARLLFVIKPPSVEDRREAIKAVDQGFAEIQKLRGRPAPASS